MGRDRSRSRSRERDGKRRRRSRSRERQPRDSRRRSRSRERSSRRRSQSRERGGRERERRSERSRSRSRDRDRKRSRSRSRERRDKGASPRNQERMGHPATQEGGAALSAEEEEKKRKKAEILARFKAKQAGAAPKPKEEAAWMPWEDPGAVQSAVAPTLGAPPPSLAPLQPPPMAAPPPAAAEEDEVDPLDAFMASEVMPEVKAAEAERKRAQEEERVAKAKLLAEGKKIPKLADLEESDEEEVADVEIQVPANKVKLVVGAKGATIMGISQKTKCRIQIKKSDEDLNKAFGAGMSVPKAEPPPAEGERKMVTVMLFGNAKETEAAQKMIEEAVANKDQKQKQRQQEYDRKREQKRIRREMYYLRHARDYETLGVPVGTSKADVRKAYRKMAVKWHPDKHASKTAEEQAEASLKFQEIQRAFDSLMSTDEDAVIEALTAGKSKP
eukprot:jgi/Tetstr1/461342/TSEL_006468.t1